MLREQLIGQMSCRAAMKEAKVKSIDNDGTAASNTKLKWISDCAVDRSDNKTTELHCTAQTGNSKNKNQLKHIASACFVVECYVFPHRKFDFLLCIRCILVLAAVLLSINNRIGSKWNGHGKIYVCCWCAHFGILKRLAKNRNSLNLLLRVRREWQRWKKMRRINWFELLWFASSSLWHDLHVAVI